MFVHEYSAVPEGGSMVILLKLTLHMPPAGQLMLATVGLHASLVVPGKPLNYDISVKVAIPDVSSQ